jgi:hypothetical protein
MKKALIILAVVLVGCENSNIPNAIPTQQTNERFKIEGEYNDVRIIIIDGCQYLYLHAGTSGWCTHKGNCNNPIHSR